MQEYKSTSQFLIWLLFFCFVLGIIIWLLTQQQVVMETFSLDNAKALSEQANDANEALSAKLDTINVYQSELDSYVSLYGEDVTKWPFGKRESYQQLEKQIFSLKVSYNSECADYNSLWQNEWKSLVAPRDLPTYCETLQ